MRKLPKVSTCMISGVYWEYNQVTHFAVHKSFNPGISQAHKLSIDQVVELMVKYRQTIYTLEWDYDQARLVQRHQVFYKNDGYGNYLHLQPFDRETKNLRHLIRVNWFEDVKVCDWQ